MNMMSAIVDTEEAALPTVELAKGFLIEMLRCRRFEAVSHNLREQGEVLGNTFPSLGQEATVAVGMAMGDRDAIFPSYRSRPVFFGCGVTILDHFRELFAVRGSVFEGREVFHHTYFPKKRVMPSSSMIGAWVPMAAGYALTQKNDGSDGVTLCVIGDGSFGAGDTHEGLNIAGVWNLPFVLVVENNGYQVSANWSTMRRNELVSDHVVPYGFENRIVDGNDPFDVHSVISWARGRAASGQPVIVECLTYRMGGYSSHLPEPRHDAGAEIEAWKKRDPIDRLRARLIDANVMSDSAYEQIVTDVDAEIDAALEQVRAEAKGQHRDV